MSKVQMMRAFVNQRLTAAAEEIFDLFEGTIAEYEEQLRRSKEENERQHKLLDAVFNPEVRLQRSDIQLLMVRKEEVPLEQQERSSRLDQEDSPEPPHIKEDQEELWSSQEGEQLQEPEEADVIKITFYPVPVKTEEDDGEKPQSPQLQPTLTDQIRDEYSKTEAKGEESEGSDQTTDFNIDSHVQPVSDDETSHSPETVTDDCNCDWEASKPQEGLNPLQNEDVPVNDLNCNTGNTSVSSSECDTSFGQKKQLRKHKIIHTGDRLFSCSVCGKSFRDNGDLRRHSFVHTGEKPLSCSVCGKRFTQNGDLKRHSVVHTGEKPFSCTLCDKRFTQRGTLKLHYVAHSGEKPFSCEVCGHRFTNSGDLKRHSIIHTGEKPFSCSVCDRRFTYKQNFRTHKCVAKSRKK